LVEFPRGQNRRRDRRKHRGGFAHAALAQCGTVIRFTPTTAKATANAIKSMIFHIARSRHSGSIPGIKRGRGEIAKGVGGMHPARRPGGMQLSFGLWRE
jgi:hypothetical protein